MSNLPTGVTNRDIDALCNHARKGDLLFECSRCLQEIHDYTEVAHHRVNGQDVCGDCVRSCELCGGMLTDEFTEGKVYEITFRDFDNDGKLTEDTCPKCASDWAIGTFLGCAGTFDADDYPGEWGKDAITQLLAKAFPLPAKEVCDAA